MDNEAVATVLNTGACRQAALQDVLREIALIAAKHQFVIKAQHIMGSLIEFQTGCPDGMRKGPETSSGSMLKTVV